eukprot:153440_1
MAIVLLLPHFHSRLCLMSNSSPSSSLPCPNNSYEENIKAVMWCCCICIMLSLGLILEDGITGLRLNQPHSWDSFDMEATHLSQGSLGGGDQGNKVEEDLLKQDRNSSAD